MHWISFLLLSTFLAVNCRNIPDTISELNVEAYMGHWYQVYASPFNSVFQGYGTCITADYGLLNNNTISVLNIQLDENNEMEQISGYGYYKNASEPGKLTVHLDGVPVDSPYWIVKLGENVDDQYQYSIITIPSGISLWVLARDVSKFYCNYDDEVHAFLDEYDFKYEDVVQADCVEVKKTNNLRSR